MTRTRNVKNVFLNPQPALFTVLFYQTVEPQNKDTKWLGPSAVLLAEKAMCLEKSESTRKEYCKG